MPNYNPDLQWYTKTSEQNGMKQRCPFATVPLRNGGTMPKVLPKSFTARSCRFHTN